jgi:hypothetical protein
VTVYRDRRKRVTSEYNPAATVPGSWNDPDTIELPAAWISFTTTSASVDGARSQQIVLATLYDPQHGDVQAGDRIRSGSDTYSVTSTPFRQTNPFTGWAPYTEVPLEEVTG